MTIQKLKGRVTGVYGITYKNKIYIGSAIHIRNRWNGHKSDLKAGVHSCQALQRIFNKFNNGWIERGEEPSFECFDFFVIKSLDQKFVTYHYNRFVELLGTKRKASDIFCKSVLFPLEQVYMNINPRNRLNSQPAAGSNKGNRPTPKTRRKISEAGKGRKHSDATRLKQSEARLELNYQWSPESRKKLSDYRKGTTRDPESVERGAAKLRKPFKIYKTGVGYIEGFGLKTYAKKNKISYGGLRDVVAGIYPMSNMHFRSEEDYFLWLKAKDSQSSKETGVYYHVNNKRWIARDFSRAKPYIGCYKTEEEAIEAVRKSRLA